MYTGLVKKMSALDLRQSLGAAITSLEQTGEPILLEKGRRPVGIIISLEDYRQFFEEKTALRETNALLEKMNQLIRRSAVSTPAEVLTRNVRETDVDLR